MAGRAPSDFLVYDPTVSDHEPEPQEPIPGWRTPIALAGWGVLIAILIALIVWGIIQLAEGAPPQEPAITIAPTATTSPPSSAPPVVPPTEQPTPQQTAPTFSTEVPAPSTTDTITPTATSSTSSPGAYPLPLLPSVITLPSLPTLPGLPGLPTEITLPPGL
jgi:cytoskeletal protein RodZ